jgi:hypothetical protein
MNLFRALVTLLLILMTGAADAQQKNFVARGAGNVSCGAWTAARRSESASSHEQWVLGFLSGLGAGVEVSGLDPLKGVDPEGVWAWVDNYCQAKPLDALLTAAEAFARTHPH